MHAIDLDELSPPYRLALAYAPPSSREVTAAVLSLDTRLGRSGVQASEPIIAQMKLAWWRDQFAKPSSDWPSGEPLLQVLRKQALNPARLSAIVDGWEALFAAESLTSQCVTAYASGRASAWLAIGEKFAEDCPAEELLAAGRLWALADLAGNLADAAEIEIVRSVLANADMPAHRFHRALRPLSVLTALAKKAAHSHQPPLKGPSAMALAMRVGIFGR